MEGLYPMIRSKLSFAAACAFGLLVSATAYAGLNGPNPKSSDAPPPVGGGAPSGIALLGGSFFGDGTIIVGVGVTANAIHIATGVYEVDFHRAIKNGCVWTGSPGLGTFSGTVAPSMISVTGRVGTTNALFVQLFNSTGSAADIPFEVHVICG